MSTIFQFKKKVLCHVSQIILYNSSFLILNENCSWAEAHFHFLQKLLSSPAAFRIVLCMYEDLNKGITAYFLSRGTGTWYICLTIWNWKRTDQNSSTQLLSFHKQDLISPSFSILADFTKWCKKRLLPGIVNSSAKTR